MKIQIFTLSILIIFHLSNSAEGCGSSSKPASPKPAPPKFQKGRNCGVRNSNRIVGGTSAKSREFPWQASLLIKYPYSSKYTHFCGATLIARDWVVTAAHCLYDSLNIENLWVDLNPHDMRDIPYRKMQNVISAKRIIRHERFNSGSKYNNDIALIQLSKGATFNDNIGPICLPSSTSRTSYYNNEGIISGWGRTIAGKSNSDSQVLKYGNTKILSFFSCYFVRVSGAVFTSSMLCASSKSARTCDGDGGGPLVVKRDGNYELIGISSFRYDGCPAGYPEYFANVPALKSWIQSKI